jgi:hypothetical protein
MKSKFMQRLRARQRARLRKPRRRGEYSFPALLTVRQALFGTAAALAISAGSVAVAQSRALPTDVPAVAATDIAFATLAFRTTWRGFAEFLGNPNARATTLNVSASTVSRTSGYTPCFVHVSALGTTCDGWYVNTAGTTLTALSAKFNPYEDVEYRISSDDPTEENFTRPTDGATVNLHTDQIGPEALFVFRSEGTWTITVTGRIKNSDGTTFISSTTTHQITVTDFDDLGKPAFYFDSVNGDSSWDGTTPQFVSGTTGPKRTAADIKAIVTNNTYRNGLVINLAYGSTFSITNSAAWSIGSDGGGSIYRWRPYVGSSGAGADPIIEKDYAVAGNTGHMFINSWSSGGSGAAGNVLSNIEFRLLNVDETIAMWDCSAATSNATIKHFYWDNCVF